MKKAGPILRALCSIGLLAYLLSRIDTGSFAALLPQFRPAPYLFGVATMMAYVVLQNFMLRHILKLRGIAVPLPAMIRFSCMSSFFGLFLPGGSGADVVMILGLCRTESDKAGVLGSFAFARVAGLVTMIALTFVVTFTPWCPVPGVRLVAAAILAAFLTALLLARLGVLPAIQRWLFRRLPQHRFLAFVDRALASFTMLSASARGLLPILPLLLLLALCRGFMDYLMARSLGLQVPFPSLLVFTTVVSLATLVPVSIAGLGVREMTFAGLFATVGVTQAAAVSVSLLSFSLTMWIVLAGGVLYALRGWKR